MTSEELNKFKRTLVGNRCWKGYKPVKGKRPYSKGSCRKMRTNPAQDPKAMMALISDLAKDFTPLVKEIEGSGIKTTQNNYGRYMNILTQFAGDNANKRKIIAMALLKAGANRAGLGSALRILSPNSPKNGVRKKTWKIGEYAVGGIIEAMVSPEGNAVGIRNAEYKTGATISKQLFRWPLDKFKLEMYLNELTTSYYADKIIQWLMAGSWELRSNPAELSEAHLQRAYKALKRYERFREVLKEYDLAELFSHPSQIRKDPLTLKILTQISKYLRSGLNDRKLIKASVQKALDTYVDDTEELLEANRRSDNRDLPQVTLVRG